jgi:hypothetical protein
MIQTLFHPISNNWTEMNPERRSPINKTNVITNDNAMSLEIDSKYFIPFIKPLFILRPALGF